MIYLSNGLTIPDSEIEIRFIRASGPGGQHVNKVATAVQLRFDAANSPTLPEEIKSKLIKLAGSRATSDGVILIEAKQHRTQERNRVDAVRRLADLIEESLKKKKKRRPTRVSRSQNEKRLKRKKEQSQTKKMRGKVNYD